MADRPQSIHVAVGVIRRNGRVLIARRPDHLHQGGLLEFPGGKVETGESVQQALVRELEEETGLCIDAGSLVPLIGIRHDYGDKRVFLDVWEAESVTGEPHGREGQMVEWRPPESMRDADFPEANRPIIRAVRLPRRYAITGQAEGADSVLARLEERLPLLNDALCLLRAPELSSEAYGELASAAIPLCQDANVPLMLHGDPTLISQYPEVSGVHITAREASLHASRPIPDAYWLAVSCHNEQELQHAKRLKADFVTLGPVNRTPSHPDAVAMGLERFQQLVTKTPLVVFGLGGLADADHAALVQAGAQGVAGISFWWSRGRSPSKDPKGEAE